MGNQDPRVDGGPDCKVMCVRRHWCYCRGFRMLVVIYQSRVRGELGLSPCDSDRYLKQWDRKVE